MMSVQQEVSEVLPILVQENAAHQPSLGQVINELRLSLPIFSSNKVCHLHLPVQPNQISLCPVHVFRNKSTVAPAPC